MSFPDPAAPHEPSSRRHSRPSRRAWYRDYFEDHPGYISNDRNAVAGDKAKVSCKACLAWRIREVQAREQAQVSRGERPAVRGEQAIRAELWALGPGKAGWIAARSSSCCVHLRDCPFQPREVRIFAEEELDKARNPRRRASRSPTRHLDNSLAAGAGVLAAACLRRQRSNSAPAQYHAPSPMPLAAPLPPLALADTWTTDAGAPQQWPPLAQAELQYGLPPHATFEVGDPFLRSYPAVQQHEETTFVDGLDAVGDALFIDNAGTGMTGGWPVEEYAPYFGHHGGR